MEALTRTHENLLSQARAAKTYEGGRQQFLHSITTSDSASTIAEHILNGPLRKIATLIRNEAQAARRREEDTLAIIQALEWEVEALECVKEEEEAQEREEEEYGMGFDGGSDGIGYPDGQGHGYEEEVDLDVFFHQGIQFSQDVRYIWDGEGYRPTYDFGTTVKDEEGQEEGINFQP